MQIHYLEIVTAGVDAVCTAYAVANGVQFGKPDAALGNARTAKLPGGGLVGVRAPMHETEEPVVRPYWLVDDLEASVAAAVEAGGPGDQRAASAMQRIGLLNERPLHAALKEWYALPGDCFEVPVDGFVIDIVRDTLLLEIQTASLASIKSKLTQLTRSIRCDWSIPSLGSNGSSSWRRTVGVTSYVANRQRPVGWKICSGRS